MPKKVKKSWPCFHKSTAQAFVTLLLLMATVSGTQAWSQEKNKYGLITIPDIKGYQSLVRQDTSKQLVDLRQFIPGLAIDLKYATANNFLHEPVYKKAGAYLSLPAAIALKNAEKDLNEKGYGLKVFDAYRPYSVTVIFYEKVKDTVFVASPFRGSRHNRGMAVDLTIINKQTGLELLMPTAFDDFTGKAHTNYPHLPVNVMLNREVLKWVMVKNGFQVYADEWWHYDFKGWQSHPVLDISFEALELD